MGFLGKIVKGVLDVAMLPVEVVKDAATMGGALTDEKEPYTLKRAKKVVKDVDQAGEDAGDGDWL